MDRLFRFGMEAWGEQRRCDAEMRQAADDLTQLLQPRPIPPSQELYAKARRLLGGGIESWTIDDNYRCRLWIRGWWMTAWETMEALSRGQLRFLRHYNVEDGDCQHQEGRDATTASVGPVWIHFEPVTGEEYREQERRRREGWDRDNEPVKVRPAALVSLDDAKLSMLGGYFNIYLGPYPLFLRRYTFPRSALFLAREISELLGARGDFRGAEGLAMEFERHPEATFPESTLQRLVAGQYERYLPCGPRLD